MPEWPIWVWVLIAVVALIIIIAIIAAGRRKDTVEPAESPARVQPETSTLEPRRGVVDPVHESVADTQTEASPVGRRIDDTTVDDTQDEDTLHAPLAYPADVSDTTAESASRTDTVETPGPPPLEPEPVTEPTSWDEPVETPGPPPLEPEPVTEPTSWDEPVETPGPPPLEPDPHEVHPETPGPPPTEPGPEVEPEMWPEREEDYAADSRTDESAEPRRERSDAEKYIRIEEGDADTASDEQGRRLDPYGNPVAADFEPAGHTDRGDYGEELPEDDVPRDDLGRRLDPYGNPVDDGPDLPPTSPRG